MSSAKWLKQSPVVRQYQFKWVMLIAACWAFVDLMRFLVLSIIEDRSEYTGIKNDLGLILLRTVFVFIAGLFMAYLMVIKFRQLFRSVPAWLGIILRTLILYCIALTLYSLLFICIYLIHGYSLQQTWDNYYVYLTKDYYLLNNSGLWLLLFLFTQLVIEVNEKYSPGMFRDILLGKYLIPKEEKKIILFIDLKDSTSIAEQLGHKKYFLFIKDFIYHISIAVLKWGGDIYQYVGDEVVISWPLSDANTGRSMQALLQARKELQQQNNYYRQKYALIPEFRAGIHCGEVMVGEIGIIKKDLAMSGDPMNTAARIKSACSDLNKKYIASKDFVVAAKLKDFQVESAGVIELKGKESGLELFFLVI